MPISLPNPSSVIRNGEIEIFYSHYGEGPLMVLLHGFETTRVPMRRRSRTLHATISS
jgi:hypothetical protein